MNKPLNDRQAHQLRNVIGELLGEKVDEGFAIALDKLKYAEDGKPVKLSLSVSLTRNDGVIETEANGNVNSNEKRTMPKASHTMALKQMELPIDREPAE